MTASAAADMAIKTIRRRAALFITSCLFSLWCSPAAGDKLLRTEVHFGQGNKLHGAEFLQVLLEAGEIPYQHNNTVVGGKPLASGVPNLLSGEGPDLFREPVPIVERQIIHQQFERLAGDAFRSFKIQRQMANQVPLSCLEFLGGDGVIVHPLNLLESQMHALHGLGCAGKGLGKPHPGSLIGEKLTGSLIGQTLMAAEGLEKPVLGGSAQNLVGDAQRQIIGALPWYPKVANTDFGLNRIRLVNGDNPMRSHRR